MDDLLLTTAIPFVNAAPHLGHALEYVQADVLARHARARGRSVGFLTGTDEHAAKNVQAAASAGLPVDAFVASNAVRFRALADALGVSYDDFIRTSADPRHRPFVEELWQRCARRGDLYRAEYEGTYCAGCEEFRDDACPEHDAPLQSVSEENWFFRLSRYAPAVRDLIANCRLRIQPDERRNEVLGILAGATRDVSVSRPRARVGDWGIPVPGDPDQLVYVWFDALANYVSAPGVERWTAAQHRTHVIGKGIVRFHAVIWPALLLSAGLTLPDELLVHDYVTARGRKIGKSLGNAVDPARLIDAYGADALRWWCAREVPRVGETDFDDARLVLTANRDLASGIGNLVQRVVALAVSVDATNRRADARPEVLALPSQVDDALGRFDLRRATGAIVDGIGAVNRRIEATAPWKLRGSARAAIVDELLASSALIVNELAPFVPDLAARADARLASRVAGAPLFAKLAG